MGDINADVIEKLDKYNEGISLGLAAVAEALQKMNHRYKQDEDEEMKMHIAKREAELAEIEKQSVVKAVIAELRKEGFGGLVDVGSGKEKKVSEKLEEKVETVKPAKIDMEPSSKQSPLMAMAKQGEDEKEKEKLEVEPAKVGPDEFPIEE